MASVELKNVNKRFGSVQVIDNIDLKIENGSFCALLGPSGCGKSTLLRMIAGLEPVSEGQIFIGGNEVTYTPPAQRKVAMVFQSYALYPHLTVRKNISFSMSLAGMSKQIQNQRADQVAKMLQLESLMDRRPAELSGGQRQRVAIGRALVREPEVFLFDEPLSNLDALLRVQMRLELAKLHLDLKTTMIYVTHDQVEAMTLADKIIVLDKGKISQAGSPLELYNSPQNKFVASFIGSPAMNFISARGQVANAKEVTLQFAGGGKLKLSKQTLNALAESNQIDIGVRPEHLHLTEANNKSAATTGATTVIEQLGNSTYVYVDTPAGQLIVQGAGNLHIASGTNVGIMIDNEAAKMFGADGMLI